MKVRLEVAKALLNSKHPNVKDMKQPETSQEIQRMVIELVAQQILKFLPSYKFCTSQIRNLLLTYPKNRRINALGELFKAVRETIRASIRGWLVAVRDPDDPAGIAKKNAEKNIQKFSEKLSDFHRLVENKKGVPSYEKLLAGRDYKQLLALSFYDIDFGAVVVYTISIGNTSFSYLGALPADTIGTVTYTANNKGHTTNPSTWNVFFGDKLSL